MVITSSKKMVENLNSNANYHDGAARPVREITGRGGCENK